MKFFNKALISLAFILAGISNGANAAIIDNILGPTAYILDSNGFLGPKSLTYTHTIIDDGFNPLLDSINSATLDIVLLNLFFTESWKAAIGLDQIETGGALPNFTLMDLGFTLNTQSVNDLLDGSITATITATKGLFVFIGSVLSVDFTPNGQVGTPVPEPGMLALLGIGLLAFSMACRRPRSRN